MVHPVYVCGTDVYLPFCFPGFAPDRWGMQTCPPVRWHFVGPWCRSRVHSGRWKAVVAGGERGIPQAVVSWILLPSPGHSQHSHRLILGKHTRAVLIRVYWCNICKLTKNVWPQGVAQHSDAMKYWQMYIVVFDRIETPLIHGYSLSITGLAMILFYAF